jgi:hypothetical protein
VDGKERMFLQRAVQRQGLFRAGDLQDCGCARQRSCQPVLLEPSQSDKYVQLLLLLLG